LLMQTTAKLKALMEGSADLDDLEKYDEDGVRVASERTAVAKSAAAVAASASSAPSSAEVAARKADALVRFARVLNDSCGLNVSLFGLQWEDAQHRKMEEQTKWWKFARFQFDEDKEEHVDKEGGAVQSTKKKGVRVRLADGSGGETGADGRVKSLPIDYSMWDKWVEKPDDPASLEEELEKQKELDRMRDEAFEKANPEFVSGFLSDMEKRNESRKQKEAAAEKHKESGNAFFKRGEYQRAAGHYHAAVDQSPFQAPFHTNLAACYLKLGEWASAAEFASRAVFVTKGTSVKGLFRRAQARRGLGEWEEAAEDLSAAAALPDATDEVKMDASIAWAVVAEHSAEESEEVLLVSSDAVRRSELPDSAGSWKGEEAAAAREASSLAPLVTVVASLLALCEPVRLVTGEEPVVGDTVVSRLEELVQAVGSDARSCRVLRTTGLLSALVRGVCDYSSSAPMVPPPIGEDTKGMRRRRRKGADSLAALSHRCPGPLILRLPRSKRALKAVLQLLSAAARVSSIVVLDAAHCQPLMQLVCDSISTTIVSDGAPSWLSGVASSAALEFASALMKHPAAASLAATVPSAGATHLAVALTSLRRTVVQAFVKYSPVDEGVTDKVSKKAAPKVFTQALGCAVAAAAYAFSSSPEVPTPVTDAAEAACSFIADVASPSLGLAEPAAALAARAICAGAIPPTAASGAGMPPAASTKDERHARSSVAVLCRFVAVLFARSLLDPEALSSPVAQLATGALAALASHEAARPLFAVRVGRASTSAEAEAAAAKAATSAPAAPPTAASSSLLRPLLDLLRLPLPESAGWNVVRGNALAALSNAALAETHSAKALVDAGAVSSLLDFVQGRAVLPEASAASATGMDQLARQMQLLLSGSAADATTVSLGATPAELRSRAAALLSRIAANDAGARSLSAPAVVERLTALLVQLSGSRSPPSEDDARTQDALLRCLAGSVAESGARAAFVRAGGVRAMGAILQSMGGRPQVRSRANGLGNLARIGIVLSSVPGASGSTLCDEMFKRKVVDGLIELIKEVGDHPARRNAAVGLAKMCKVHPPIAEHLRSTGGMSILMSLGKELG
jgi:tetratricopeptide (TPR) repeat protein